MGHSPPALQSHRNQHGSIDCHNFLLVIQSSYGPISYCFRDIRQIRSETQCFLCRVFNAPSEMFRLEFCNDGGAQITRMMSLSGGRTRSSADADNRLDAFSGQSRSTNMVPFHMLHIVSYCAIVTLSLSLSFLRYSSSKNFMTLKWGQRSLKVIESGIIR